MRRFLLPAFAVLLVAAPVAQAFRLPEEALRPIANNPANRFVQIAIDDIEYDEATHCSKKEKPGVVAFTRWLQRNAHGVFWGSYRCEKWGKHSASLHAENRAIDWHLDAYDRTDRAYAAGLIALLLAPDTEGNPQALARRMGVQELIWDCGYWGAGMTDFSPSSPCYTKRGKLRKNVNRTIAHRDHIHIGMTKPGAKGRTSFWSAR